MFYFIDLSFFFCFSKGELITNIVDFICQSLFMKLTYHGEKNNSYHFPIIWTNFICT